MDELKQRLVIGARFRFKPYKGVFQVLEVKDRGVVSCDVMPDGLLQSHRTFDAWEDLAAYANLAAYENRYGIEIIA